MLVATSSLLRGLQAIPPDTRADIVITDLVPLKAYHRASAIDWIGSLRTRFRDAPLLVVTAHADEVAEPDMLSANAIIAKPFDVERCSRSSPSCSLG